jgi:plasmid stabilization system protein ParE
MRYSVEYSDFFFNDLATVADYLSKHSSTAPARFKALLQDRIGKARAMPEMYAILHYAPKYRHIVIEKYVALYRVDTANRKIYMYRLLHGAQDIQKYL